MERLLIKNIALGTGGTQSIAVTAAGPNDDLLYPAYRLTGSPVLVSDLTLAASGTPSLNMGITLYWEANVDVVTNSRSVIIFGKTLPTSWATKNFIATCVYDGAAWQVQLVCGGEEDGWISAADLESDSVITSKILDLNVTTDKIAAEAVTNAKLAQMATITIKGNDGAGPAVPQDLDMEEVRTILDQDVTLTGDVTGTATQTFATGVTTITTTIAADTIDTAMIADDQVTVAKVENNLTYETLTFLVSFESGEQCNNRFKLPYPGTIVNAYAVVVKALSNTDAGTIVLKNAAGTTMTLTSALSFALSSALETAVDTAVTANNSFSADDILYATTAKTTVGGKILLSLKITRS